MSKPVRRDCRENEKMKLFVPKGPLYNAEWQPVSLQELSKHEFSGLAKDQVRSHYQKTMPTSFESRRNLNPWVCWSEALDVVPKNLKPGLENVFREIDSEVSKVQLDLFGMSGEVFCLNYRAVEHRENVLPVDSQLEILEKLLPTSFWKGEYADNGRVVRNCIALRFLSVSYFLALIDKVFPENTFDVALMSTHGSLLDVPWNKIMEQNRFPFIIPDKIEIEAMSPLGVKIPMMGFRVLLNSYLAYLNAASQDDLQQDLFVSLRHSLEDRLKDHFDLPELKDLPLTVTLNGGNPFAVFQPVMDQPERVLKYYRSKVQKAIDQSMFKSLEKEEFERLTRKRIDSLKILEELIQIFKAKRLCTEYERARRLIPNIASYEQS